MQKITINDKVIELDIDGELTVKHLRKIQPILTKYQGGWQEVEMVIEIVKTLATSETIEQVIDAMNIQEFTQLSEKVTALLQQEEKKN